MNFFRSISQYLSNLFVPLSSANTDVVLRVVNRTRQAVLAERMDVANTSAKRRKGLLGHTQLLPGEGLWIRPCESVHTFGMRFSIDIIYLDRQFRIKKTRSSVPPWRMSACLSANSVIELPAGTLQASLTEPGDQLEFTPVSTTRNGTGDSLAGA